MSNHNMIEKLKLVLANSYSLYLKTQNYHWNVEGPNFKSVHDLLEIHYSDLASAIDDIAELIRTLGEKAPGTFKEYYEKTQIKDGDKNADCETMLTHLAQDQKTITNSLISAIKAAQEAENEPVVGVLTERMAVHQKNHWMLISMLK